MMHYEEMHLITSPVPPPPMMAAYKEVQSDIPDRILRLAERQTDMAERQATHRQDLERAVVSGSTTRSWAGLVLGAIIILAAIICGTYLIATGREASGLTAIIVALGGLVGTFIYGYRQQQSQLQQRNKDVPELPQDRR